MTRPTISIRPWTPQDEPAVQGLLSLLSDAAEVRRLDAPTYVATSGDQVIGMVTLCVFTTLTGPKAYLDHLVVAPDFRRQGIGRSLVEHAINLAAAAGASRVDLTARPEKRAARDLYRSLGFRERDETTSFRLSLTARS